MRRREKIPFASEYSIMNVAASAGVSGALKAGSSVFSPGSTIGGRGAVGGGCALTLCARRLEGVFDLDANAACWSPGGKTK